MVMEEFVVVNVVETELRIAAGVMVMVIKIVTDAMEAEETLGTTLNAVLVMEVEDNTVDDVPVEEMTNAHTAMEMAEKIAMNVMGMEKWNVGIVMGMDI